MFSGYNIASGYTEHRCWEHVQEMRASSIWFYGPMISLQHPRFDSDRTIWAINSFMHWNLWWSFFGTKASCSSRSPDFHHLIHLYPMRLLKKGSIDWSCYFTIRNYSCALQNLRRSFVGRLCIMWTATYCISALKNWFVCWQVYSVLHNFISIKQTCLK